VLWGLVVSGVCNGCLALSMAEFASAYPMCVLSLLSFGLGADCGVVLRWVTETAGPGDDADFDRDNITGLRSCLVPSGRRC
jgi:hypothetical protein